MSELRHLTLTLNGAVQQLLDAISTAAPTGGADDVPVREVVLQAGGGNGAAVFIGGSNVSATNYGFRIPAASGGAPVANSEVRIGPYESGPLKLSGIYVIGTLNEKLHALFIPW